MRTWGMKQQRHEHLAAPGEIDLCCYEGIGGMKRGSPRHADEAFDELR